MSVDYTLVPVVEGKALVAVDVSLSFRGNSSGVTRISLPDSVAREKELWRSISNITVTGARMDASDGQAQRSLYHHKNARIVVRYRITQESSDSLETLRRSYRPIIQPTYFHLLGAAALVLPDIAEETPLRVRVIKLPKAWQSESNLEHRKTTLASARSSVLVGGDIRILRPSSSNPTLRIAMLGDWSTSTDAIATRAADVHESQRRFWGDAPSPYLITILQIPEVKITASSILRGAGGARIIAGGTSLENGFAMFAPQNVDDYSLTYVLAHEGMHRWIVEQQGGLFDERHGRWLNEGFAEFYKTRVLVRDGIWTTGQFALELNRVLRAYANSPMRSVTNDYIANNFFVDADVSDQAYQRGRLLALMWDARLQASGGLDRIMQLMRRDAREMRGEPGKDALSLLIEETSRAGVDITNDLAIYVDQGNYILLPEDLFAPCGRIVTTDVPVFDRGFDSRATKAAGGHVAGIDRDSNAYRAGLRNGVRLIELESGEDGNSEKEFAYRVEDNGVQRTIRYFPQGRERTKLQQLVLTAQLNDQTRSECRVRLSGAQ